MDERASVHLIEALSGIWSKIRSLHPEVPGVLLLPAPASRDRLNVLGHFAALRWTARQRAGQHLHEVVVVAEHLDREVPEIVETLLHEAAHALNFDRGVHDCSRSQYHNRLFKEAAEEIGLKAEKVPHYGFALTSLPPSTKASYAKEAAVLSEVLVHRLRPAPSPSGPSPSGGDGEGGDDRPSPPTGRSRSRKATCACPFIIRVARATLLHTVIRCESCGEPFRLS